MDFHHYKGKMQLMIIDGWTLLSDIVAVARTYIYITVWSVTYMWTYIRQAYKQAIKDLLEAKGVRRAVQSKWTRVKQSGHA